MILTAVCILACLALLWGVTQLPFWIQLAFWIVWIIGWLYFLLWILTLGNFIKVPCCGLG